MEEKEILDLIECAVKAQSNSYSPYSKYKVGAAVLTKDNKVYLGTNIENSAYSPSNCAERSAIFAAISNGDKHFKAIAVVAGDRTNYASPCGVCRQVMTEFFDKNTLIIVAKGKKKYEYKTYSLSDLLPNSFNKSYLG